MRNTCRRLGVPVFRADLRVVFRERKWGGGGGGGGGGEWFGDNLRGRNTPAKKQSGAAGGGPRQLVSV